MRSKRKYLDSSEDDEAFNPDADSVFVYTEAYESGSIAKTKTLPMMQLFGVKSKEEWESWVALHLKERSDRVGEFLQQFAITTGVTMPKSVRSISTMIKKIGESFELDAG